MALDRPPDFELLGGYLVRADAQITDRLTAFIGYADAPDASDGRAFKTRAIFGGIVFALHERFSLKISGSKRP